MNAYKIWVRAVMASLALFIAVNFAVWGLATKTLLTPGNENGDYTRVGYIAGSSYAIKRDYQLPRKHLENEDYQNQPVDVLTIGDSFSNGCGKRDQYYQDWIASIDQGNVLNVQKLPGKNSFETVISLLNSGYLDLVHPKVILIEIIERHAIDYFSKPFDMNQRLPLDEVVKDFRNLRYLSHPPRVGFLNVGNMKFLLYAFLYRIKDNAFFSKVYMRELTRPFFSVKNEKQLIFAYEDFEHLTRENEESIKRVNENFNRLAQKLEEKGIKLYFMPVVDKYNLYADYLMENPYPRSHFFETLRALNKKYNLIDTKEILLQELKRGERDVFYADDSHWSWKAPKKIFETVRFEFSRNV